MSDADRSVVGYTHQRTTQLSDDQDDKIEMLARGRQLSVSAVMRAAIREYLASESVQAELTELLATRAVA